MNARLYASVWDALVDHPDEAADLTARSILLIGVRERVRSWALRPSAGPLHFLQAPRCPMV